MYNISNSSEFSNWTIDKYLEHIRGPKHLSLDIVLPVTLVYVIIFVTGIVGNIAVCLVILRKRSMRTVTNYYLFSLAVSDLTFLVLGLPYDLGIYWQQYPWTLGVTLCKLRTLVSEMTSYTSVLTIVAFSTERYLAICHPLHSYTMSNLARTVKIIAFLWVLSLVSAAPFAVFTSVSYVDFPPGSGKFIAESAFCGMIDLPANIPLYEISGVVFFLFPVLVIAALYVLMGLKIRRRTDQSLGKRFSSLRHDHRNAADTRSKGIIRMLAAVVVAFFLSWAPFHAQRLMYVYGQNLPNFNEINEWLYYITGILYYVSSTVNPILYSVMSAKYRDAFKRTICCCCMPPSNITEEETLSRENTIRLNGSLLSRDRSTLRKSLDSRAREFAYRNNVVNNGCRIEEETFDQIEREDYVRGLPSTVSSELDKLA